MNEFSNNNPDLTGIDNNSTGNNIDTEQKSDFISYTDVNSTSAEQRQTVPPPPSKKLKIPKQALKKFGLRIACLLGCVVIGVVVGAIIPVTQNVVKNSLKNHNAVTSISNNTTSDKTALSNVSTRNINLIKNVKSSVVCITTTVQSEGFFNIPYETEGAGSGIIFSKTDNDIYIVTNCHVVEGAEKVAISVDGSNSISARLIGKDTLSDLAVIAVSTEDLKSAGVDNINVAYFGDSDQTEVGDTVIAIGNAMGEGITATDGIVSVVNKELDINGKTLNVLQTDAAINPGNSGGALVNSNGEVVGINTAKLATTSVEGIGYSITSNYAKQVIEKLMNNQNAPFLGVYISDISEEVANAYNLPQTGVMVSEIVPYSSAASSDIQPNDIITGVDNKPIFTKEQLIETITEYKVGDTVEIKLIRNGKTTKTVSVKLKANPNSGF